MNQFSPSTQIINGNLVVKPILLMAETPQYVGYIAKKDLSSSNVSNRTDVIFSPSENFAFKFSKDDDCNIDIYIHMNPKRIIKNISNIFTVSNLIRDIAKM